MEIGENIPKAWKWWKGQTKLITFSIMIIALAFSYFYVPYVLDKKRREDKIEITITSEAQIIVKVDSLNREVGDLKKHFDEKMTSIDGDIEKKINESAKSTRQDIARQFIHFTKWFDVKNKKNNEQLIEYFEDLGNYNGSATPVDIDPAFKIKVSKINKERN